MKALYDRVADQCSKEITRAYSTSFSLGILFLHKKLRAPIYSIYGFVRLADEIVDTFHDSDQATLLAQFRQETYRALEARISLNPMLHSFQETVNRYNIDTKLIDTFLDSMAMDLDQKSHDPQSFQNYILGSAEVVGLMCLWVFCQGDAQQYTALKASAMRLGSAFQKVNFLRDLNFDCHILQRNYFPGLDVNHFSAKQKAAIEADIRQDFKAALQGIRQLPKSARFGVYVAYIYYLGLLEKIEKSPVQTLLERRLRLPQYRKFVLLVHSFFRYRFKLF